MVKKFDQLVAESAERDIFAEIVRTMQKMFARNSRKWA